MSCCITRRCWFFFYLLFLEWLPTKAFSNRDTKVPEIFPFSSHRTNSLWNPSGQPVKKMVLGTSQWPNAPVGLCPEFTWDLQSSDMLLASCKSPYQVNFNENCGRQTSSLRIKCACFEIFSVETDQYMSQFSLCLYYKGVKKHNYYFFSCFCSPSNSSSKMDVTLQKVIWETLRRQNVVYFIYKLTKRICKDSNKCLWVAGPWLQIFKALNFSLRKIIFDLGPAFLPPSLPLFLS